MSLGRLISDVGSQDAARDALELMEALYPLCRSLTGSGLRRSLDLVEEVVPLERHEVPTGTPVYDWEIPPEWNIRDAYIVGPDGRRVVDFRAHNLHVVNYSMPVRRRMGLEELQPHLHSLPDQPGVIPYRTTYWREDWGFCLRHEDRERLGPGPYDVVIDSDRAPGYLTYAETVIPGTSSAEGIIYTHTCHPSLVNDNLSGVAITAVLARAMQHERPRLTWRFIFGAGTIGSLAWLSRNEDRLHRIEAGLTLGLLGDSSPLTYKRSRRGDTVTDRATSHLLAASAAPHRLIDFEPYGYDERQFCSPGFDLPVGRLSRARHGEYPQYHTSADDLSLVSQDRIAESIAMAAKIIGTLDANRRLRNLFPKGEPRLGKRGLFGSLGGKKPADLEHAMLWVLSFSDGRHDLLAIAQRSGLDFRILAEAAEELERAGLLREDLGAGIERKESAKQ